jgi:transcription termination/antitermination protein NusA
MAVNQVIHGSTEMLQIADAVAREKNIDRDTVLDAMANAIEIAGRKKYGVEHNIKAEINKKTGAISLFRLTEVVEDAAEKAVDELGNPMFNPVQQLTASQAKKKFPKASYGVGDFIRDELPPIDFGRVAAQTAKQVIVQKVRDAERDRQFDEFKDRVGEIVNGTVKRVEYGNVTVDFGRAEAVIRKDELIPRENFRPGDRIRAYIYDVRREKTGPQVFLSRVRPEFMACDLFHPRGRYSIGITKLACNDDLISACHGLDAATRFGVLGQARVNNRIRNLITDFIGVPLGYGFTGKNI